MLPITDECIEPPLLRTAKCTDESLSSMIASSDGVAMDDVPIKGGRVVWSLYPGKLLIVNEGNPGVEGRMWAMLGKVPVSSYRAMMPFRIANLMRSILLWMFSLLIRLLLYHSTVLGLTTRISAISRAVRPSTTSFSTSLSRLVS